MQSSKIGGYRYSKNKSKSKSKSKKGGYKFNLSYKNRKTVKRRNSRRS